MPNAFDVLRQEVLADSGIYESPNTLTPDEATMKARALRAKVRPGQSVTYVAPDGQTFRAIVKNVTGSRVLLKSMSYGPLLVDLIQFKKNDDGGSAWLVYGQPEVPPSSNLVSEAAMHIEEAAEHLKVLKDPKIHKILQNIFTTYISDQDLAKMPAFLQAVDNVVFEMRDGVHLQLQPQQDTDEDDDEDTEPQSFLPNAGQDEGEGEGDEQGSEGDDLDAFEKEVTASLNFVNYDAATFERTKNSLMRHLSATANTSLAHPAVKDLRNNALKMGFRPSRTNPSIRDGGHKHLISLRKETGDKHVLAEIYHKPDTGEYTLAVSHTKRGAKGDELIRPHKKVFPGPKSLRKHGTAKLRSYV